MNCILRMAVFALLGCTTMFSTAHASVQVCNSTVYDQVRVALVFNKDSVGRVARGWWTLESGKCATVHDGFAGPLSADLWLYAETRAPNGKLMDWNESPDCNHLNTVDCVPRKRDFYCVREGTMPNYPGDVHADVPSTGCENGARMFVQQARLDPSATNIVYRLVVDPVTGDGVITSSTVNNQAFELKAGRFAPPIEPWRADGWVAGCNADQGSQGCGPRGNGVNSSWSPPRLFLTVCSFEGHKSNDNGDCTARLVGASRKVIEFSCNAHAKPGIFNSGGGGHADYYLDSVVLSSDPLHCAVETGAQFQCAPGKVC